MASPTSTNCVGALPAAIGSMSLDLLQGQLAAAQTVKPKSVAVSNEPPRVIVSQSPAILVPIDGSPVIRTGRRFALRAGHQHAGADRPPAPRQPLVPARLRRLAGCRGARRALAARRRSATARLADLAHGSSPARASSTCSTAVRRPSPKPSLASGVPTIYVTPDAGRTDRLQGAAELRPDHWHRPAVGRQHDRRRARQYRQRRLLHACFPGRWYRAPSLNGPWTFVAANALPADFARIPKDAAAGVVLASVAGTAQAQEALIANSIPQTAAVPLRNGPTFTPSFDGAPQWRPIAGTPLQYVVNAATPIIQVGPNAYYAVQAGVWFTASRLTGPWTVASSVPAVIYGIPPSSPLHYVTYVQVYGGSE
jgi:hypothetical protein